MPGSDDAEDSCGEIYEYNGEGFIAENFCVEENEDEWCDYCDDYCDRSCNDCSECPHYNRCNAVCILDEDEECDYSGEAEGNNDFDPYVSNIVHCGEHCQNCPLYRKHHKDELENTDILSQNTTIDETIINNPTQNLMNNTLTVENINITPENFATLGKTFDYNPHVTSVTIHHLTNDNGSYMNITPNYESYIKNSFN